MFNKTVIVQDRGPRHISQSTTVHEHRAPTDHSVALLAEFQEKAEAKVIKAIAVEDNKFNCVVHTMHDCGGDRFVARAIFDLNGHKMHVDADVSGIEVADKEKLILKLRDAVALKIANESLSVALRTLKL